jgi:hypothetical protein
MISMRRSFDARGSAWRILRDEVLGTRDPKRECRQAAALARATKPASLQHVVWSTLEDTR